MGKSIGMRILSRLAYLIAALSIAALVSDSANAVSVVKTPRNDLLVSVGPNNFALSIQLLKRENDWQSITLNGDEITFYGQDCRQTKRRWSELSKEERTIVLTAYDTLAQLSAGDGVSYYSSSASSSNIPASYGGQQQQTQSQSSSSMSRSYSSSSMSSDGQSVIVNNGRAGDSEFSTTRNNLPNNWGSVMLQSGMYVFVYKDTIRVEMVPAQCVSAETATLVQQIHAEDIELSQATAERARNTVHKSMRDMQDLFSTMGMNQPCFPFCNHN